VESGISATTKDGSDMPLREPKMLTVGAIIVIGYCALELLGPVAWAWIRSLVE
jgi:hypothetical protein